MLNAPATRPEDARITRHRKELGTNRQAKGILRAVGIRAMRTLIPQPATLLLAQEPLPSLDIFGRHKAASAIKNRPSNQRNTRSDAVHKEPPGRTVPHIIAYATAAPNEKGPTSFEVSPWSSVFKRTSALRRCDTGELNADVIGRRAVLDGFAVNTIRVGAFHPNVDVNGNALIANALSDRISALCN